MENLLSVVSWIGKLTRWLARCDSSTAFELTLGDAAVKSLTLGESLTVTIEKHSYHKAMIRLIRAGRAEVVWTHYRSPLEDQDDNYAPCAKRRFRRFRRYVTDADVEFSKIRVRRKRRVVVFDNPDEGGMYYDALDNRITDPDERFHSRCRHFEKFATKRKGYLLFTGRWLLEKYNLTSGSYLDCSFVQCKLAGTTRDCLTASTYTPHNKNDNDLTEVVITLYPIPNRLELHSELLDSIRNAEALIKLARGDHKHQGERILFAPKDGPVTGVRRMES